MSNFVLSCCSTADLSKAHFEKRDISYICFHFSLNDQPYTDDLGQSIPFPQFYQAMRDGAETKTSQVNEEEYIAYFAGILEQGKDILHVCLSSGLSGSFNSARLAKEELEKKYPDRKIYIVDSLGASSGFGLFMETLADLRDQGMDIDALYQWAMKNRLHMHLWFFSTDLSFFVKGGRISKTAGFLGTMLRLCPLMNMDHEGHLIPREKIRTKKKAVVSIVEKMKEHAQDGLRYSGKCFISHSDCLEDAQAVAALVEESFPHLCGKVLINDIGTTIGSHTGPGTVALFFWGDERME